MKTELKIGHTAQQIEIPDQMRPEVLLPNPILYDLTGEAAVRMALEHPIGCPRLRQIVKAGEKIVIVSSDITRPMPTWLVMPALLDELYEAGVKAEDITLVFALGSHRKHTEEEKRVLAGERAYKEIRCEDSDALQCVRMGMTSYGTPVDITKRVAEADRRICLGNIEYHYFAGYSGGAKAIMPGVSTREAIQANHSRMTDNSACAGNLETNPIRKDIEEAADICGVDFIVNVILDEHKQIIQAVAGDVTKAHRAGCAFLDRLYRKDIQEKADIVIVSQGGTPKDLNLYQTQKALDNAKHAVKDGGTVILMGSCREGFGEQVFEDWMLEANDPEELIERIKKEFRLGGHKAAAIAMVLRQAEICLVSELPPELVKRLFMRPYSNIQEAFDAAAVKYGEDAKVILMPYGGSTLPRLKRKEI